MSADKLSRLVVTIRDATNPDAPPVLVAGGERVLRAVLEAVEAETGIATVPPRLLRLERTDREPAP